MPNLHIWSLKIWNKHSKHWNALQIANHFCLRPSNFANLIKVVAPLTSKYCSSFTHKYIKQPNISDLKFVIRLFGHFSKCIENLYAHHCYYMWANYKWCCNAFWKRNRAQECMVQVDWNGPYLWKYTIFQDCSLVLKVKIWNSEILNSGSAKKKVAVQQSGTVFVHNVRFMHFQDIFQSHNYRLN